MQARYTVRGATLPYYLDPSKPMPSAEQKATATTPGWEDWDGDGNPGITGSRPSSAGRSSSRRATLLASEAVRAADPALHFAQFARLAADQATGDDSAICNGIVALAPTLTPEAAGM